MGNEHNKPKPEPEISPRTPQPEMPSPREPGPDVRPPLAPDAPQPGQPSEPIAAGTSSA